MAYQTWSWTNSGIPNGSFDAIRKSPILKQTKDGGYTTTRPLFVRDIWNFSFSYNFLYASQMVEITNFFHAHRGGQLFYFYWPFDMYGIPVTYGGGGSEGSGLPFASELDLGYGEGLSHLVRFGIEDLSFSRLKVQDNWWSLSSPILIEQV